MYMQICPNFLINYCKNVHDIILVSFARIDQENSTMLAWMSINFIIVFSGHAPEKQAYKPENNIALF